MVYYKVGIFFDHYCFLIERTFYTLEDALWFSKYQKRLMPFFDLFLLKYKDDLLLNCDVILVNDEADNES